MRRDGGRSPEIADPIHLPRLLRLARTRDSQCPERQPTNECTSLHHWMSSSARTSMDCGIVKSRAFAVLMLKTSSKLAGLLNRKISRPGTLEDLDVMSTLASCPAGTRLAPQRRPQTSLRQTQMSKRPGSWKGGLGPRPLDTIDVVIQLLKPSLRNVLDPCAPM